MVSISTVEDLDPEAGDDVSRRRRRYGLTSAVLALLMAAGVIDAIDLVDVYGVDDDTVRAAGGGYDLAVRYGSVTRPALATPFEIVVRRPGGFDGPITVGVDRAYLEMWDENGLIPAPSAETSAGELVLWEFDPPVGETLTVWYDARIEPAAQSGRSGSVAVLENDIAQVEVTFHTRVWP
jgi:hypothetical protein